VKTKLVFSGEDKELIKSIC